MRSVGLFLLYASIIFLIVEGVLRWKGFKTPRRTMPASVGIHSFDSLTGWKPKPGTGEVTLNKYGDRFRFTIGEDHGRTTRPPVAKPDKSGIDLIGCSFFFGTGVDDHETYAWKLQERYQEANFRNYSVGGQGTYQALLALERRVQLGDRPKSVIYGMISHHEKRNIASHDWLEMFYYKNHEIEVKIPFVTLDENAQIIRHAPTSLTPLPFSDYSVTIYLTQKILNKLITYQRELDASQVMELLIQKMDRICKENEIDFYVAVLYYEEDRAPYLYDFFTKNNIKYINCQVPLSENNTVKDDGHPVAEVHEEWAIRIGEKLYSDGILTLHD